MRGNLQCLGGILEGELFVELEDAELPGDTYILLNVCYRYGSGSFGQILAQLVGLYYNGGKLRSHRLGQQGCGVRLYLQPQAPVVGADP